MRSIKGLPFFLFLLLTCSVCTLQAQDVIRVKRPDTCGINLAADTTLLGQTVRLSLFKITGLNQKETEEVRSQLGFQQMDLLMVSMDSICKNTRPAQETKKHRLTAVKIIHVDEPGVTDYPYVMIQLVYDLKNKPKELEKMESSDSTETASNSEE
jgi:hypothetical protein